MLKFRNLRFIYFALFLTFNFMLRAQTDVTNKLKNPSFESGFTNWTQEGMQTQTNTAFALKDGNTYVEKWVERGNPVGDGSVTQLVKNLSCGRYRLTVSAQNIQEDTPSVPKTGAWLVADSERTAVGVRGDYSVTFVVITGDATIGFEARQAQGNWIALDHFRLEYLDEAIAEQKAELNTRIQQAEALLDEYMNAKVRANLSSAIEAAKGSLSSTDFADVAKGLRTATDAATLSIQAYSELKEAITHAVEVAASGGKNGLEDLQQVINTAQGYYDNDASSLEQLGEQVKALADASFAFRLANASGTVPIVKTNPRYARGAIEAFGRMTVSGVATSQIEEQGFCWSTEPEPTVMDNRSTDYLECNGRIYRMPMEPATVYYVRPYVMTKTYAVGYGDVIKLSTLPLGHVTYTYDYGGDEAQNNRIVAALDEATYYWTNYTSIRGFNVSCVYSPGTPTADCGYGGNMRMGSNMGQRAGTCMHEMNHGIGGGTIPVWGGWNESPLRTSVNGDWAGEHANEVLRFWENRDDLVITAAYDGAHWGFRTLSGTYSQDDIWVNKYAFNGAHLEPGAWAGPKDWNGTQIVFIGNALINQAMCEDGLVPVNYWSGGFCLPSYDLVVEDHQKYFIKSEAVDCGLYDSFLVEGSGGKLRWTEMNGAEAADNDSAAWYVSFDPKTQYYSFKNVATNHLITFSGGFKAVARTAPTAADKFHVMRGRTDVKVGKMNMRGYWLIHPENSNTPSTLTAGNNQSVYSTSLDLHDSAVRQRWVFVSADDLDEFESGSLSQMKNELASYLRMIRKLLVVPHREDVAGANEKMETAISTLQSAGRSATSATEVKAFKTQAMDAAIDFLGSVTPTDINRPFDLTFMVNNADISSNDGWTGNATFAESCCEYFQSTFNFHQTIDNLPDGNFKLMVQAFQRPGNYEASYNAFSAGRNDVSAVLYAGGDSKKVCHIADDAQKQRIHDDDVSVGSPAVFIPNTMASAAAYFKKNLYDNEVWTKVETRGSSLTIGIRGNVTNDGYWTIFDNFRLYFYGQLTEDDMTPIIDIASDSEVKQEGVYDLSGRRLRSTNDLNDLPSGVYVVGGRKVFKR